MNKLLKYIIVAACATAVWACSTTSRIPEYDLLYTGTKNIQYVIPEKGDTLYAVPEELKETLLETVDIAPNNYLSLLRWRYPFPLGLWAYNNWPNPPSGFRHWLYETFAEEPVLISDVRPEVRTRMIEQLLDNQGFFRATATYELVHPKNKRKASVVYTVNPGPAFYIDRVELPEDTTHLLHLIDSIASRDTYLHPGVRFSTDSLSAARTRITNVLRNKGYYFFRPDFIEFLADSTARRCRIDLRLALVDNMPKYASRCYVTGDIYVVVNRYEGEQRPDTVPMGRGITLVQMQPTRLRRDIVPECVRFRQGKVFSVRDMNRTQTALARLGIFRSIDISALPDTTAAEPTLDVLVDCRFDAPLEASIEVNASSKSNSYIGPGLTLGLTNRNIFGGGEQLSIDLTGTYEWQTGHGRRSLFNSYEFGLNASLAIPRLLAPKWVPRSRYQLNWTRFQLGADLLNRPHYFKMAQFNASVNYDWRWRRHVSNTFTPLKLTYTKLMNTTEAFDSIMAENPAVAQSFISQFIPQMIYSYTYDRRIDSDNSVNFQFSIQEAGNIMWAVWRACGVEGEKKLFGTPFSQFVKGSAQVVYNRRVIGNHRLVCRVAVGAEHAYGNSAAVPYAEQFYVGGANSVRAFTVRSIGPGRYHAASSVDNDYFDQTGTFKFEANVEYRFPLAGALHGAFFLDAGNVWLLRDDPSRPGGKLEGGKFFRDLATGTGLGLRLDMDIIVVRADLGIGIHLPYDTGHGGYYNMESFGKSLAFHLAIGYPF